MKKVKTVVLGVLFLWMPLHQSAIAEYGQDAGIAEFGIHSAVIDYYIKGLKIRNFDLIRTICLPEAVMMSAGRDGELHITTLDKWSQRFDPKNPPFQTLDATVLKIDREGTAAQVKILFIIDGERRVTDYLNLLELNGRWRITHIIDY